MKKLTQKEFVKRLKERHGTNITVHGKYVNGSTRMDATCNICGNVWDAVAASLSRYGCRKCADTGRRKTHEQFVLDLKKVNPKLKLLEKYVRSGLQIKVLDTECGHTWSSTKAGALLDGVRCPECCNPLKTHKQFVLDLKKVNPNLKVLGKYGGYNKKVHVKDISCGHTWSSKASSLLEGTGCHECRYSYKTQEEFVTDLKKVNPTLKVLGEYTGSLDTIKVKNTECGHTWNTTAANDLLRGTNCGRCWHGGPSVPETELFNWIKKGFPDAFQSSRRLLEGQEIDIYIPSLKVGIEFNGLYWHSSLHKTNTYHFEKTLLAESKGIRLLHIWQDDWETRKEVTKKTLRHLLGKTKERIFARKCVIKITSDIKKVKEFYNNNHMQGAPRYGLSVGLFYEGKCVSIMTFSKVQSIRGTKSVDGEYELIRFASTCNVVGGASKLLAAFRKSCLVTKIISYSDNDLFTGGLYSKLGFKHVKDVSPDYHSVINGIRKGKVSTCRKSLAKLLGDRFNPDLSESVNCLNNNILRCYDSGKKKWELII